MNKVINNLSNSSEDPSGKPGTLTPPASTGPADPSQTERGGAALAVSRARGSGSNVALVGAEGSAPSPASSPRRGEPSKLAEFARKWIVQISAIAALVGLWWAVAAAEIWPPILLPSPFDVFGQLFVITGDNGGTRGYSGHYLQEHLWFSMSRLIKGGLLAILLGVPVGILLAVVAPLRWMFGPAIDFLRNLPPLAYFSLLVIWFGIDETPKVTLLFLAAFPPVVIATSSAVMSVPVDQMNAARMLGASRLQTITNVMIPSIAPEVMTGIRVALGVAFTTVVAAETINGIPGIGGMVSDAQRFNATEVVLLGIIVIGICGLLIDLFIRLLDRLFVPWRGH